MRENAARMRKRMLWAAPGMVLCGLRWHAGGAAAWLAFWLSLAYFIGKRPAYPYPRKRKAGAYRLFFSAALCAASLGGLLLLAKQFLSPFPGILSQLLVWTGAVGLSLPLGGRFLALPLSKRAAIAGGTLLLSVFAATQIR